MAERWQPDRMVTAAVLDGRLRYADLSMEDSRWVVADLTAQGHPVEQIAGWLKCSTRQVKRVRAELVTRVMVEVAGKLHANEIAHLARQLSTAKRELEQFKVAHHAKMECLEAQLRALNGEVAEADYPTVTH